MFTPPDAAQPDTGNSGEAWIAPILDTAPGIFFMFDAEGRFARWNRRYLETLGLTDADMSRRHPLDLVPPEQIEPARQAIATILAGAQVTMELDLVTADGGRLTFFGTGVPVEHNGRRHVSALMMDITEHKRAEADQRLYANMVAAMPDHLSVVNRDYVYVAVNDAYLHNHGLPREAIVGHHVAELLGQELFESLVKANLDRCLVGERVHYQGWFEFHVSGRRYMDITYTPHLDATGQVAGVIVASRDITELELAHQSLLESDARFRALVDQAPDALFIHDLLGRFLDVNQRACESLGYSRAELLRMEVRQVEMDVPPSRQGSLWQSLSPGQKQIVKGRQRRKDGSIFPVEIHLGCLDLQGETVIMALARDISERRQAEEKLLQAAAVFDNAQEGILITDAGGCILAVNQAFREITGYTEAEVLGQTPGMFKSGRHDKSFYRDMWETLARTGRWQGEVWDRRKDGEIFPKWLSISAIRDPEGQTSRYVALFADITHLKESEARLEHLAHFDPLTDLPNRLLFHSRLEHALEQARRHGHRLAILFLDLDRFKTVNDSLGHPAGDELLVAVSQRVRARLRDTDTLARLGGDEFVILLEQLDEAQQAAVVAMELLRVLKEPIMLSGGHEVFIGASIGISLFPDDAREAMQLVRNADAALYQAKDAGRNTYSFYTESLTREAEGRLAMEGRLRYALERGEFVLHYQPLVAVADGRLLGVEALVRWRHPEDGLVAPAHFIPIAEENGLIVPLGEWVLRTACAQMKAWLDRGLPPLSLAVNISPRQFQQDELAGLIRDILKRSDLPPELLELEITEGAIMQQGDQAIATLHALKALGVRLAIDDFGTGYSSLAYLKRFPIDKLKIDRGFVRDIPGDSNDVEIAATIIAMARNLKLEVLAEGVETQAQLAFLREHGCDACQGYLFSRPLPADEIAQLLEEHPYLPPSHPPPEKAAP